MRKVRKKHSILSKKPTHYHQSVLSVNNLWLGCETFFTNQRNNKTAWRLYLRSWQHTRCCETTCLWIPLTDQSCHWVLSALPVAADTPVQWADKRRRAGRGTRLHPDIAPAWYLCRGGTSCWSRGANHPRGAGGIGRGDATLYTCTHVGNSHRPEDWMDRM